MKKKNPILLFLFCTYAKFYVPSTFDSFWQLITAVDSCENIFFSPFNLNFFHAKCWVSSSKITELWLFKYFWQLLTAVKIIRCTSLMFVLTYVACLLDLFVCKLTSSVFPWFHPPPAAAGHPVTLSLIELALAPS